MHELCSRGQMASVFTSSVTLVQVCFLSLISLSHVSSQEHEPMVRPSPIQVQNFDSDLDQGHKGGGFNYFDPVGNSILRSSDGAPNSPQGNFPIDDLKSNAYHSIGQKRYLDSLAAGLIKKDSNKRFLDPIAGHIIKKSTEDKRFIDSIASDIIGKRYLDRLGSSLIKKSSVLPDIFMSRYRPFYPMNDYAGSQGGQTYDDFFEGQGFVEDGNDFIWPGQEDQKPQEHFSQSNFEAPARIAEQSKVYKFNDSFNRFLPEKKENQDQKRFLDSIAGHIIKKEIDGNENIDNNKRYLDGIASSLIKREDSEFAGDQEKRYLDKLGSSLIKREYQDDTEVEDLKSRMFQASSGSYDDLGQFRFMKENMNFPGDQSKEDKRYLDKLGSSLIKKNVDESEMGGASNEKRYMDSLASSLIKREDDEHESDKRYLDNLGSSLIKKSEDDQEIDADKRYLDTLGSSLVKKENDEDFSEDKRYLDTLSSSLIKKDSDDSINEDKRYLDTLSSSLIKKDNAEDSNTHEEKRYLDKLGSSLIKKSEDEKRYLDNLGSSLIKKEHENPSEDKRYLDRLGSSLIKRQRDPHDSEVIDDNDKENSDLEEELLQVVNEKYQNFPDVESMKDASGDSEKRYLDGIASSLIKKEDNEKRYLDGLASSLIKKDSHEKRYLDGLASSLIKKEDGQKRYLDGLASSLIKKEDNQKRYLDGLASSLIKKEDNQKRYLDGLASSLIKKDTDEKRYLDGIASSLIKKEDNQKRYLDGIASSLIKKSDGEKRYLDGLASSLIKKNTNDKRYLDGIASSLIKKDDNEKRYLDGIASSLIKKEDGEKRYLDGIASSLIKKESHDKRYLDGIASSLIKKDDDEMAQKRYLDGIASSLIKKDTGEKRYLDGIASSLIKKDSDKRYLDNLASSLVKKEDSVQEKRYLDKLGSSLIKKQDSEKRYLDGIASSLIKKEDQHDKRYLDKLGSSLIKKDTSENPDEQKRYLDNLGSSLIKREDTVLDSGAGPDKRVFEVTDDVMDGSKESEKKEKDELLDSLASVIAPAPDDDNSAPKSRKRRDVSLLPFGQGQSQRQGEVHSSLQRQKRFIDGIASNVLYKRFAFSPRSLKKDFFRPQQDEDDVEEEEEEEEVSEEDINKLLGRKDESRPLWSQKQSSGPSLAVPQQPLPIYPNAVPTASSFSNLPQSIADQSQQAASQVADQAFNPMSLMENPSQFQFSSYTPESLDLDGVPKSLVSGTFWTFNKIDPIYDSSAQRVPVATAQPQSYQYGQVIYPYMPQAGNIPGKSTYSLPRNTHTDQRLVGTVSGNRGENDRYDGEMYKRVVDDRTRELEKLMKHPYIDKVAALTFDKNKVFKKRYLDTMASSLFHKRYLDSLATGLIKRRGSSQSRVSEYEDRDSTKYVTDRFRRKRFSTKYSPTIKPQFDVKDHVDSLKRYIDSIASDLLYKRGPKAQESPLEAPRRSTGSFGDLSQRVFFPMASMRSRLRSFQPETAPKGKKLASAAITWGGRPTLMTAMFATGKGPDDEETKAYLHHALRDYVHDVTKSILDSAKTAGEKLHRSQNEQRNFISENTHANNYRWHKGKQRGNRHYFDSLAGGLLT